MENFPANSKFPRPVPEEKSEPERILKVVEGSVTRRKKPLGRRFRETFLGDNDVNVFDYVMNEVLVPAVKDTINEAVSTTIEKILFGNQGTRTPRRKPSSGVFGNTSQVNYNRYSSGVRAQERQFPRRTRSSHDFEDIILETRFEAQNVLDELKSLLLKYEVVSVKELYELLGAEFHHTDEKWGWTDLSTAGVRRVGNAYLLVLPKTEPLD